MLPRLLGRRAEDLEPVAAELACLAQGFLGTGSELVGVFGVAGKAGDAETEGESAQRLIVLVAKLHALDGRAEPLGDQGRARLERRRVGQQDGELSVGMTAGDVDLATQAGAEQPADLLQDRDLGQAVVLGGGLEAAVALDAADELVEPVDVRQDDRERLLVTARAGRLGIESL